jgi:hypothetical protein
MSDIHLGNIWAFKTANFEVTVDAYYEDDLDLSWDEDGEVTRKLDAGVYTAFRTEVIVTCDGIEVGSDHLGGSIYENISDFRDHIGGGLFAIKHKLREGTGTMSLENWSREYRSAVFLSKGGIIGSYFKDMVGEAIRMARGNIRERRVSA